MEHSRTPDIHGVIAIDKPRGPTSMSMVNLIRRRAGKVKTGHAGTLDPLATGVLVLGLGRMTKRLGELTNTIKRYTTVIDLSATTIGHDAETPPITVEVRRLPSRPEVETAVQGFHGAIMQAPPIFSAVKIKGRRAYAAARKGEDVTIDPRPVVVREISVIAYDWPTVTIEIECEKGFYVRSLARDLGEALNVGGYCLEIRRTAVGPFTIEMAIALEDLPDIITQEDLVLPDQVDQLLSL
jgi:tRNA pseudouridine55 synthase